jgi:hypothetical protein
MPLNEFARELLTASGSTYANPPANYFRRTRSPVELAETTAQVFLGQRLLCAKCHNHPTERWKQDDFYSLAAYFARVGRKLDNLGRRDRFDLHELNGEEQIGVAREGEVLNPRTGLPAAPGLPEFLLGVRYSVLGVGKNSPTPPPAARVPAQPLTPPLEDRRLALAEWLTRPDNPHLARALANRIWYHLMGRGIVDPVDDLRESNPPANPELLEALARELSGNGWDLRHLVQTIMNSRTYQLASDPNATNADDDRFFSRAIPQRLPAEVLLDAIVQVTGIPERFQGRPAGTKAIDLIPIVRKGHPFLLTFGQPTRESACECEREGETTLGQSFALISGEMIDAKLKHPENRIGRLMAAGKADRAIVEELYLAALTRPPNEGELAAALRYVSGRDRRAGLEDLMWGLINCKEFLLRR